MRNLLAVGLLMVVCGAAMGQAITGGEPTEVEKLRSEITRLKAENAKLAARLAEFEKPIAESQPSGQAVTFAKAIAELPEKLRPTPKRMKDGSKYEQFEGVDAAKVLSETKLTMAAIVWTEKAERVGADEVRLTLKILFPGESIEGICSVDVSGTTAAMEAYRFAGNEVVKFSGHVDNVRFVTRELPGGKDYVLAFMNTKHGKFELKKLPTSTKSMSPRVGMTLPEIFAVCSISRTSRTINATERVSGKNWTFQAGDDGKIFAVSPLPK